MNTRTTDEHGALLAAKGRRRLRVGATCLCAVWILATGDARARDGSIAGQVTLDLPGASIADLRPIVVYLVPLDRAATAPAPRQLPRIHQKNAKFAPGFMAVSVGQTVEMPNDDAIYHNVFSYSRPNDFDLGLYAAGKSRAVTFEHPGLVKIYCSIHENMNGTIFVSPSRYFDAVDASGSFELTGVPPGRYRLETWCEKLPDTSREIVVTPGERLSPAIPLADDVP
jgi:plastocyanin